MTDSMPEERTGSVNIGCGVPGPEHCCGDPGKPLCYSCIRAENARLAATLGHTATERENAANKRAAENARRCTEERVKAQRLQFELDDVKATIATLESENASLNSAVSSLKDQVKALIAENTAVATSHQNLRNENDKLYRIANDRLVRMRKLEIENARLVEALEGYSDMLERECDARLWVRESDRAFLRALIKRLRARSTQPPSQTER
jgi:chromosome segregation ATPase